METYLEVYQDMYWPVADPRGAPVTPPLTTNKYGSHIILKNKLHSPLTKNPGSAPVYRDWLFSYLYTELAYGVLPVVVGRHVLYALDPAVPGALPREPGTRRNGRIPAHSQRLPEEVLRAQVHVQLYL